MDDLDLTIENCSHATNEEVIASFVHKVCKRAKIPYVFLTVSHVEREDGKETGAFNMHSGGIDQEDTLTLLTVAQKAVEGMSEDENETAH